MEKGIDSHIKEYFDLPKVDVATYSPLALAYIGDGIYAVSYTHLTLPTKLEV